MAIGAIRQNSIKKRIMLPAVTVQPAATPTVNVQLQNVGLLRGITVVCTATVTNNTGGAITLSDFGPANMFSNIQYNDLSNITRIQTTGAHVYMIDCLRRQGPMGAAFTHDIPGKFGANWSPITAPATISTGASATIRSYHYIPVAYSDNDFRGAVFSNITNASQSIALTFNSAVASVLGGDSVNSIYGIAAGTPSQVTLTNATIQVYQDVYDQLPDYRFLGRLADGTQVTPQMWQAATGDVTGLMLPNWQMRYMFELKFSPFSNLTAGVENVFPYTNQRMFLSTIAQYNAPARALGTDIAYWRLVAANSYEWWKMDPITCAFEARRLMGDDFPAGFYVFDSREKTLTTSVSGNLNLVVFPTLANTGANANIFYEDFALTSTLTAGSSFAGGN
jgi:hypothetical protein